ncbi:2-dehydro-3-deoxyglucarate aldolase [Consotaella salsifontis]|uniref:5-dehydro-4-deoxy-D-glucarate aldolase n=1 Tax=Consotaella salsifontis TaxID=1365950 RepID=A0A1T4LIR0_9HYPH|nr:2-dehydro-3-deoxyglucarate aldolase [Consotaella salsifontis]SJZ54649.1 5-dehydro-4-deoxy-D-glucarate aldolase [Consotaella salsifontis]
MSAAPAYNAFPNSFRRKLLARERLIGCWSALGSPIATEVLGLAGFDWLLLDAEHAPNDVLTLIPQLMALKDSSSAPVVRPPWNEPVIIKRLLDAGFYNLLIPFVQSVEEAKAAVAATRYPPQGIRGVSVAQRNNRYGTVADYQAVINDNIAVAVQIENGAGVEAAAEIAAIDGVDCLFVGPSDLAASLGHLGHATHEDVQAAIKSVFEAAAAAGKASGILAPVEAEARRYLDMGANMVAVGSDLGAFKAATSALCQKYR